MNKFNVGDILKNVGTSYWRDTYLLILDIDIEGGTYYIYRFEDAQKQHILIKLTDNVYDLVA